MWLGEAMRLWHSDVRTAPSTWEFLLSLYQYIINICENCSQHTHTHTSTSISTYEFYNVQCSRSPYTYIVSMLVCVLCCFNAPCTMRSKRSCGMTWWRCILYIRDCESIVRADMFFIRRHSITAPSHCQPTSFSIPVAVKLIMLSLPRLHGYASHGSIDHNRECLWNDKMLIDTWKMSSKIQSFHGRVLGVGTRQFDR